MFGSTFKDDKKLMSEKKLLERINKILLTKISKFPELQSLVSKTYVATKDLLADLELVNTYELDFEQVSQVYVEQGVYIRTNKKTKETADKHLYLFEIYSKDFAKKSSGKENLHTTYFKLLFDKQNLNDLVFKLSGGAEVFFRPKSLKSVVDKERKTKIDVIGNKRYTEDKILLHLPISLNANSGAITPKNFNIAVNKELVQNKINIIGIDRGEKHLGYYCILDGEGNIIENEHQSLNVVNGISYHQKLDEREKQRKQARLDWQAIANIKELKEGYASHAVKKLCDLVIKYNAIVIFEDLNSKFKRGRTKIEKQVYQKLELALVKKLNFLVLKHAQEGEFGHPLKAFQLTSPIQSVQNLSGQTGVIFYTAPAYTSTTCPNCGFRKDARLKTVFENVEKSKELIQNLRIQYEVKNNRLAFTYKIADFSNEKPSGKNEWTLYSDVIRYKTSPRIENGEKRYITNSYQITERFIELFDESKIDWRGKGDITDAIINANLTAQFYKNFLFYFGLLLSIRNSSEKDDDFIQCPVCSFDSRNPKDANLSLATIINGDANGAYNIARKGLYMINKIRDAAKAKGGADKLVYKDLFVSLSEWDSFVQK